MSGGNKFARAYTPKWTGPWHVVDTFIFEHGRTQTLCGLLVGEDWENATEEEIIIKALVTGLCRNCGRSTPLRVA